eukprot:scaffold8111_cov206-Skeletonema_marinoi.AAC.1
MGVDKRRMTSKPLRLMLYVQFPHSAPTQHASQFSSQHASLLGGGSDPTGRPPLTCLCFQELVSILQDPTEVHIFVGFASFASSPTTASPHRLFCSALPFFFLQHKHLHLKEAVAATAADFEDDFEEKSPSAKSFSLRGAVAVASAEDAADEDDEGLIQYGWYRNRDWSTNPYTGKHWGSEWQNGDNGENPRTGKLMERILWRNNWLGNSCAPKNFEDEEFDSQDLEMFDASEGDEVYSDYDEVDEQLIPLMHGGVM